MVALQMTHRNRIESCLSGKKLDQVPVALWRHFPIDDQATSTLAAATIAFQKTFDFDFIKVSPSSSYCLNDWGVEDRWMGNPEGSREYTKFVIEEPEDWMKLKPLNPRKGALGNQFECLKIIVNEFSPNTPIIQTIFSPLAQAKNLISKDKLLVHMRQYPDALHEGLKIITETTYKFIEQIAVIGIDGVFYSIQHAQHNLLTVPEFESFQKAYDMKVLEAAKKLWLNVGHIHGENLMFDKVVDYPFAVLNWHDRATGPTLAEGQKMFKGVVCGGLRQWETMAFGNARKVKEESLDAIHQTNGNKFILGTGCVSPITTPHGNFMAASQTAKTAILPA
jgi:uroporphyrinogen decarboxylase